MPEDLAWLSGERRMPRPRFRSYILPLTLTCSSSMATAHRDKRRPRDRPRWQRDTLHRGLTEHRIDIEDIEALQLYDVDDETMVHQEIYPEGLGNISDDELPGK